MRQFGLQLVAGFVIGFTDRRADTADNAPVSISIAFFRPAAVLRFLLGPPPCALCAAACDGDISLCAGCRRNLAWMQSSCRCCGLPLDTSLDGGYLLCGRCLQNSPPVEATFAPLEYTGTVRKLLLGFKSSGDLVAGKVLGDLLALHLLQCRQRRLLMEGLHLLPIPLHARRLRRRGFNQSLELCRPLARLLRLPVCSGLMYRTCDTAPFQSLTARQRRQYARSLFAVRRKPPPAVLLVDDVMTTGTTVFSAARTLRDAGCQRVFAAVAARTPR